MDAEYQRALASLKAMREKFPTLVSLPEEEFRRKINDMYANWVDSGTYDKDMETLGYESHSELAELMSQYIVDRSSRLLDCACGTGLVGQQLKERGFLYLDGLDASKEALDISREKKVYTKYICELIGTNRLPIEDDIYDGITMAAALASDHVRPDCFPELARITKPGGYIIFNVRESTLFYDQVCGHGRLDDVIQKMAAEGYWDYLLKKRTVYIYKLNGGVEYCYAFVVRVLRGNAQHNE